MRLTPLRVLRLLEAFDDREALSEHEAGAVPVEVVRRLFEQWKSEEPGQRTFRQLARLAGYDSSSTVQRLLGLTATSAITHRGVYYPGRIQTSISSESAARLVRAMGYLPCDVPGL